MKGRPRDGESLFIGVEVQHLESSPGEICPDRIGINGMVWSAEARLCLLGEKVISGSLPFGPT